MNEMKPDNDVEVVTIEIQVAVHKTSIPFLDKRSERILSAIGAAIGMVLLNEGMDCRLKEISAETEDYKSSLGWNYEPNERYGFKATRGAFPWKPGDELPEVTIRRLRDEE